MFAKKAKGSLKANVSAVVCLLTFCKITKISFIFQTGRKPATGIWRLIQQV